MTGVLEEYPLDFSRPELRSIRDVLARVLYQPRDLEDLVLAAGLNPGHIDFSGSAVLQWRSILVEARAAVDHLMTCSVAVTTHRQSRPRQTRTSASIGFTTPHDRGAERLFVERAA
jgi:effector-associated domain 1 (EAD1)-containing protein